MDDHQTATKTTRVKCPLELQYISISEDGTRAMINGCAGDESYCISVKTDTLRSFAKFQATVFAEIRYWPRCPIVERFREQNRRQAQWNALIQAAIAAREAVRPQDGEPF